MKKALFLLSYILLIGCFSCSHKNEKNIEELFKTEVLSNGRIYNDAHLKVNKLIALDSTIWINSEQGENDILYAYTLNGKFIAQGITYGPGPEEILEVTSIHPFQKDCIAMYDARKGKLHRVSIEGEKIQSELLLDSLRFYDDVVMLPYGRTIKLPLNSSISYVLSDLSGNVIDSLSYFPPKPELVKDKTHFLACTGALGISPEGKNLIRTVTYDGGLDFFSIDTNQIDHKKRFTLFNMDYDAIEGSVELPIPNDKSKTGYSTICVTNNYVYASFSNSKATDNPDGECDEIHLFDLNGNPIKRMMINNLFNEFTVTPNDSLLFVACDTDEKTIIYKYSLTN